MDPTIILYALVAGGLVFWLRSVLGTRHGDERERPNPFAAPPATEQTRQDALPEQAFHDDGVGVPLLGIKPTLPRNVSLASEDVERGLAEISRLDREFDAAKFVAGAQDAFVIIVEAFAQGDRDTLKNLLAPGVYAGFDAAINDRDQKGERCSTEIHAVRKMEILSAGIAGKTATITVRIIADETCIIRNAEGNIIAGDPDRITEMNDIWTFVKDIRDRNPVWYLQETRDGDANEDHKTPVPGTI